MALSGDFNRPVACFLACLCSRLEHSLQIMLKFALHCFSGAGSRFSPPELKNEFPEMMSGSNAVLDTLEEPEQMALMRNVKALRAFHDFNQQHPWVSCGSLDTFLAHFSESAARAIILCKSTGEKVKTKRKLRDCTGFWLRS